MTADHPVQRDTVHRMCGRKMAHASKSAAARAMRKTKGSELHVYQCPHCKFWHVGHRPKGKQP